MRESAGNLAVLVFYKYTDFLIANLDAVLQPAFGWRIQLLGIALPIGVVGVAASAAVVASAEPAGVTLPVDGVNLEEVEKRLVVMALERTNGNQTRAAEAIAMPLRTFVNKVRQYNLSPRASRK